MPRFVTFTSEGPDADAYELVHADGEPEGAGGVVLVGFLAGAPDGWGPLRALLSARQGYLGSRLYRGQAGFVAVVRWSSPLMYARALKEPEIAGAITGLPFAHPPALYLPA